MYPGVELRLYRYVAVLAEELNFTRIGATREALIAAFCRLAKLLSHSEQME